MSNLKHKYDTGTSPPVLRSSRKSACNFMPQTSLREQIKQRMKDTGIDKKIRDTQWKKEIA